MGGGLAEWKSGFGAGGGELSVESVAFFSIEIRR